MFYSALFVFNCGIKIKQRLFCCVYLMKRAVLRKLCLAFFLDNRPYRHMSDVISDSRFYMWRTLFAIVHTDGIASQEEVRFMAETLEDVPFNAEQRAVLENDIYEPKDITKMFEGVTEAADQAEFFKFAQALVHVDGDYGVKEQEVMLQLQRAHLQKVSIDDLIGKVELAFEGESDKVASSINDDETVGGFASAISKFKKLF